MHFNKGKSCILLHLHVACMTAKRCLQNAHAVIKQLHFNWNYRGALFIYIMCRNMGALTVEEMLHILHFRLRNMGAHLFKKHCTFVYSIFRNMDTFYVEET